MRKKLITRTAVLFFSQFVFSMLLTVSSAQADTHTWDGSEDALWNTAGNWDINAVPAATGDSLTFSGTANQANTNNAGVTTISTLTLSNGGWDISLGSLNTATPCGMFKIEATGDSTLRGNFAMGDGSPRTITLNGTAGTTTLTIADKLTFYRANNSATLTVNGAGNTLLVGSLALGASGGTKTINGSANVTVNGPMSDNITANFIWSGSGTFTLNGINTYDRPTYINGGTFALGSGGSIDNVSLISIGAGATFDVSAQSSYTLSTNLTARGIAATPATIKGASAGTVSLGGNTVTLNWGGASSGVVSDSPPLTIADAELVLNNDPLIINVPGTALGEGVYTLISTTGDGSISGTVNSTPVYSGNGQDIGLPDGVVSISGNSVILTIAIQPKGTMFLFE